MGTKTTVPTRAKRRLSSGAAASTMVRLGGNLFVSFTDAERAAYGASQPIYAVRQFAQSVMRTAVGDLKLDKLFSERGILNVKVKDQMDKGDYIREFGNIAKESNTMIIPQNMSDLSSIIATGNSVFNKLSK